MKKWWIYAIVVAVLAIIIPICVVYGGTPLFAEKAMCKIGKTSYSSLAEAIEVCEEGGTIEVYNDIKEKLDNENLSKYNLSFESANNNVYVEYKINKAITIKGISQNYKKPKIYGSFKIEVKDTSKAATLNNLEIINDYISLEDDQKNQPFKTAVEVLDGNIEIKNCTIHKSKQIKNDIIIENNLSCLSGIRILRKNNTGETLNYIIDKNTIENYDNFNVTESSFAISFVSEKEGFMSLEPYSINNSEKDFTVNIYESNKIKTSNTTMLCFYNQSSGIYSYLKTNYSNLIKEENFEEGSIVEFFGDVFDGQGQDFNVYGQMYFNKIKNVNFYIKTFSGKVSHTSKENASVTPVIPLP